MWECEVCGGEVQETGGLGNRLHGRCRQCGMDTSIDISSRSQYTVEEQAQIDELLEGAIEAEEIYSIDELEEYSEQQRRAT